MEHEIITAWAGIGIGVGQLLLIAWGLRQMGKASEERNRKMDQQDEALRQASEERNRRMDQQDEALRQQGQVLAELLRRSTTA